MGLWEREMTSPPVARPHILDPAVSVAGPETDTDYANHAS